MRGRERKSRNHERALLAQAKLDPELNRQAIKRRRWRRIQFALRVFLILCTLAGSGTIFAFLWCRHQEALRRSDRCKVHEVTLSALKHLSQDTVMAAARIGLGDSIFDIDGEAASRRLMSLSRIRNAVVQIDGNAVQIQVEERRDAALLARGRLFVLDREGVPLGVYDPLDPIPGPIITGVAVQNISFGKRLDDPAVAHAMALLAIMRERHCELVDQVSEIVLEPHGKISLVLSEGGILVHLRGNPNLWDNKLRCILPVLEAEENAGRRHCVKYLDICGQRTHVGYHADISRLIRS